MNWPLACRAETILSGVIIRPDPEDANSTCLSLMLQTDIKGWIPHFVVNAFMARAPGNWQTNLTDYYWNTYSKQQEHQEPQEQQETPDKGDGEEPQEQQETPDKGDGDEAGTGGGD